MSRTDGNTVHLSVRELVEFVLNSGDIDNRRTGPAVMDAMSMGAAVHRLIQKSQDDSYTPEVAFRIMMDLQGAMLEVSGRADGIIEGMGDDGRPHYTVDEIKGVYRDIQKMDQPVPVHLAQAICYAYILAVEKGLNTVGVRMTYVQLEEEDAGKKKQQAIPDIRYFHNEYSFEDVETRFFNYVQAYRKWALFVVRHRQERKESAEGFEFPYDYRPGQKTIVRQVFRSVEERKRLFVQAPTGIGKTLAMLYPSVRAVGMDMADKIFYLTAKTVTGAVAEEGMSLMYDRGLRFSFSKITAKDKLCPFEERSCNPDACPRAKGHFDRVNEAVYDCITHETAITREVIERYAEKHSVCPYEMNLDVTYYVDVIICDYNYAFAPHVMLQRYFASGASDDYIFLIDEAHNLVDRARDMFSATLVKEDILAAKHLFEGQKTILKWLDKINRSMLALKRECEDMTVFDDETFPNVLVYEAEHLYTSVQKYLDRHPNMPRNEELLNFYFNLNDFLTTYQVLDKGYVSYASFMDGGQFYVKLFCIDPSARLMQHLESIRSAVFFSATFLPIHYYKALLTGDVTEDAIYVDSPFNQDKRALLITRDVSSRYKRRNEHEYRKIADYILGMVRAEKGNYLAFFPSYKYLSDVMPFLSEEPGLTLVSQTRTMDEADRDSFLKLFGQERKDSLLGLCVMGGVFSEGIDLKNEALIGVAVVGTGLPQLCAERELIRHFFDARGENGFDFAYRFPGFNKVMQAAGRLIRTADDCGVVLLMDERFAYRETLSLFPKEWSNYRVVDRERADEVLRLFWKLL
ncbi:MAG: ATP-dependent DNA helicase [Lachnospiraceae bacterium]|nr:ATP-dependent DNA helicase [Lachnospiraceae bacterium]